VESLQACTHADSFNFICDGRGEIGDRACIEAPKQAAEIKTEDAVAMIAQALLHDFPDISGLEETV
jgi:hypothetical protein